MKVKNKILMLTTLSLFILMGVQLNSTNGAVLPTWLPGNLYTFGMQTHSIIENRGLDGELSVKSEVNLQNEVIYNITSLNLLSQQYQYIPTTASGIGSEQSSNFGMDDFISSQISLSSLLFVDYSWDEGRNITVLGSVDFGISPYWFIEPDWVSMNSAFSLIFNRSEIIDTLADPYEPIIHNITLGDFLDSLPSFTINGKDTLEKGIETFSSTNTEWIFKVDLTGIFYTSEYNSTLGYDIWYPSEKLDFEFSLRYTDGGVLDNYLYSIDLAGRFADHVQSLNSVEKIVFGGLESLTGDFAYVVILPAFIAIFIAVKLKLRKSKEL